MFRLSQNPEERKKWTTIICRKTLQYLQILKTLLFVRDTGQKITLQLYIMEIYVPVTHPQCLTALNKAYLPLFHLHQEKLLELIVKLAM